MQDLPTFPRVASWGREDWPRCRTLIMQPSDGFAVVMKQYEATIAFLAMHPEPSQSMVETIADSWRRPVHEVWRDVHAARKGAGHA